MGSYPECERASTLAIGGRDGPVVTNLDNSVGGKAKAEGWSEQKRKGFGVRESGRPGDVRC